MIANYKKQDCPGEFHAEARRTQREDLPAGYFFDGELKQFPDVVAKETNLFQYVDYVFSYVPMFLCGKEFLPVKPTPGHFNVSLFNFAPPEEEMVYYTAHGFFTSPKTTRANNKHHRKASLVLMHPLLGGAGVG